MTRTGMDARKEMLRLIRSRRDGFSLPRPFYIDPAFFRLDLELIWGRDWLFVGHDCELPDPGTYFTVQIGDYPVVVVRDLEGRIRAFHNTCRHRGSRVCTADKGAAVRLVCPYHQWSYNLDGRLLFARQVADGFDKTKFGLKRVVCESVAGYIFVCLADEPEDFAPVRRLMEPYFAPHRLSEAKLAYESTTVENGNWKLVWENNRECYHCPVNHPELCRTFPETPTVSGVDGAMSNPELVAHWDRCEAAGLPSVFQLSESGQYRTSRIPLLDDAVSYTMSGRAAVHRPLSDAVAEPNIGSLLIFHYPSTWNHVLGDHAVSFQVMPVGPMQTRVRTKWLVHKDAVEGKDYSVEELTHVWLATNDQDRRVVEENQIGIRSPAYEPGFYSPQEESGVMQFVDWYCRTMQCGLGGDRTSLGRVA